MDLYVVLGVTQTASDADIKRAYRRLARRYHPDINPGDGTAATRFQQILAAYEALIDPERRQQYDAVGGQPSAGPRRSSGFQGFDFAAREMDAGGTFGELFADVLTGRYARRDAPPARGADLHQTLALTFEEGCAGVERAVTVTRFDACRGCAGSGQSAQASGLCPGCQGSGETRTVHGHMVFSRGCPACGGDGQRRPRPCEVCGGSGRHACAESVAVRIPAGIAEGDRVRVPGKGHAGTRGGEPGDLYITIAVGAHAVFTREGDDVVMVVPLAIHEAALGARVEITTLDGPAWLRVPPGTQSGQRFRLRERGVPSARGGPRGDLIIDVRLMLPTLLDERSKDLLREFGRLNSESVRDARGGDA